jgi:hypothetical protein
VKDGLRAYSAVAPALGLSSVERFVASLEGQLVFGKSATGDALVRMILPVACLVSRESEIIATEAEPWSSQ